MSYFCANLCHLRAACEAAKVRRFEEGFLMRLLLRSILLGLGTGAVLIGLSIFCLGASFTGNASEAIYDFAFGSAHPGGGGFSVTGESEIRFFSAFWIAYGVLLLMVAQKFEARSSWVPGLAAVFFAGGVGRFLAWQSVGAPHPVFLLLMAIELILPVVMIALWYGIRRKA